MKMLFKWTGIVLGGLLAVLVLGLGGLAMYGNQAFKPLQADRPLYPISADTSPEGLARGKYLMEQAMNCTGACHTPEKGPVLSGAVEEISQGPVWALFAVPNLTSHETGLGSWTDAEIARAIREGVGKDNRALMIMPSYNYNALSDSDVAAVIGYLRSLEPVDNPIPEIQANWLAKALNGLGMMGQSPLQAPITMAITAPQAGTMEYGGYMLKVGACSDCHGADYGGGEIPFAEPGTPPAANLTPGGELVGWTVDDFIHAVRDGVKPSGKGLSEHMPRYGSTDEDLAAIFAYLKTLPAVQPK